MEGVGLCIPHVLCPKALLIREAGHRKLTKLTPCSRGGKEQSEAQIASASLGASRPTRRLGRLVLRLSDTQVPLGAAEELKTKWGPASWIYPWVKGKEREREDPLGPSGRVLGSMVVHLGLAWSWLVAQRFQPYR